MDMKKKDKTRLLIAGLLVLTDLAAMALFHRFPSFFFPAYRMISKYWAIGLSTLFSFSPIAVWDIALPILAVLFVFTLIDSINARRFLSWFFSLLLILSLVLSEVILGWMLNHYGPGLAEDLGYEVTMYDSDVLYETCEYFLKEASRYALQMERDHDGHLKRQNFFELASIAGASYETIGKENPALFGSKMPVKNLSVIGEYLMYNGIIGMYMPVTGEAGVPATVPSASMPFTMAHEAAHRLGIASEEEANFAAFLACMANEDLRFLYSGYYSAFSYCYSSLYSVNPDKCRKLISEHAQTEGLSLLLSDRRDTSLIYDSYESPLHEISDEINDTYLKTFSQESGIQSYGEVTDDLIAWYKAKKTEQP